MPIIDRVACPGAASARSEARADLDPSSPKAGCSLLLRSLRSVLGPLAALWLVFALSHSALAAAPATAADRDCSDFDSQAEAQRYFIERGGPDSDPDRLDSDGDGIACESLPAAQGEGQGCERPRKAVTVRLSRRKYPEATLHFEVAWRHGVPRRYTIARGLADENRDAWEPLVPGGVDADGDGEEDDRDEVPMAFTKEGGRKAANGRSASHIAYVDASDNRGAGSSIGGRLRKYCNGTRFWLKLFGRRTRTAVIVVALRNGRRVHQVVRRR
jgi:Excalibur calcium-binding domain